MTLPKPESNMTLVEESIKCLQVDCRALEAG